MSTELAKLSDYEARAEEAVKQVNRGMEAFAVELKHIKDLGLWKGAYDSFEQYCETRWSRTVRTVQRALKAHTVRQKLLAVASSAEKPLVEAASTRTLEAVSHESVDEQMKALTIGRREPTAKQTADFYSSGPLSEGGSRPATDEEAAQSSEDREAWKSIPNPIPNQVIQCGETLEFYSEVANLLRTYPLNDEKHRGYMNYLADRIEKGEPA